MINQQLSIGLPPPWSGQIFETDRIGPINFLVGPNGSGKSQFATTLYQHLRNVLGGVRLLSTDRLNQMPSGYASYSRAYRDGIPRNSFGELRNYGQEGLGLDALVILEERMDLRVQVEATLSHLFDREIVMEWDSGTLIPMARNRTQGNTYRLDRDECHGIKEILVLLTQLYDGTHKYLVIDEPELNLHPQYQAFFMQEVRKLAGDPMTDSRKKTFFLVTHSPFILDFRSPEDLKSVISFNLDYSVPKQVSALNLDDSRAVSFTRRLNAHHKQLFFSDNPIFVEGIHDAQLIAAMMEARGVSVAGAGSCIIDSSGVEEVNQYFELCKSLDKDAHFVYDLDSLFSGNLRACVREDDSVISFLAAAGLGKDFGKYCGQLDRELTDLIDKLLATQLPYDLKQLGTYLSGFGPRNQWDGKQLAKGRVAVMKAISEHRSAIVSALSVQQVEDIEGRRNRILSLLREKNIHVLPGGTLESYLPHYKGDEYELSQLSKQRAVSDEIGELASITTDKELEDRYGELFNVVNRLPSKSDVDLEPVLRNHLSKYIHDLQNAVVDNPEAQRDEIQQVLNRTQSEFARILNIRNFDRQASDQFTATIQIMEMLDQPKRIIRVDETTNAGMKDFKIEFDHHRDTDAS